MITILPVGKKMARLRDRLWATPPKSTDREKFVAYFHNNKVQKTDTGPSLETQRKSVIDYLERGRRELVAEFSEMRAAIVLTDRN